MPIKPVNIEPVGQIEQTGGTRRGTVLVTLADHTAGAALDLRNLGWHRVDRGHATLNLNRRTDAAGFTAVHPTEAERAIASVDFDAQAQTLTLTRRADAALQPAEIAGVEFDAPSRPLGEVTITVHLEADEERP